MLMAFGHLDTLFGNNGQALTPFTNPSQSPQIREIHLSGGGIVAAGPGGIAKYTSAGQLDNTFGTSTGKVKLPNIGFTDMEVDSSGRVYVLGTGSAGVLVLRYTSAGILDTGFATGGTALVTTNSAGKSFSPQALGIQSDGKILVAGVYSTDDGNSTKTRVFRLKSDGTGADSTWGTSGIADVQMGVSNFLTPTIQDTVTDLTVLADGKVLITGGSHAYAPSFTDSNGDFVDATFGDTMFTALRLTTGGQPDTGYGTNGVARSTYSTGTNVGLPTASTATSDSTSAIAANPKALTVVKFDSAGHVAFNKTADLGHEFGTPVEMTSKSDGRFFILGQNGARAHGLQVAYVTSSGIFSNVIYTDDTDKDTVDIEDSTGAIAIAADGDLLVGGRANDSSQSFELVKMDEGNVAAPRPDEWTNARANDVFRDALGGIHVAYFDAAAKVLKYVYRAPNGLWEDPVTVDATQNAGQYLSIGANAKGEPGIAYFEGTHGDFKFAYKITGAVWKTETVQSSGSVGLYPSLKFDNSGRPTVLYYNKTKGDAKFAVRNVTTNKWSFETIQSSSNVGRSGDLQIDPVTGRFAAAYADSTNNAINYALHLKGGKWSVGQAVKTVGGADFLSLSYTYFGRKPAIAYYDANRADLKLTTQNSTSSTIKWTTRLLASKGKIGLYNTLIYDGNGAHIYSYDKSNDQLVLVDDSPSGLVVTPIVKNAGNYAAVFSESGIADMTFYDAVNGVVKERGAPASAA
jgi:uncharacterized delta-60 repeat protein